MVRSLPGLHALALYDYTSGHRREGTSTRVGQELRLSFKESKPSLEVAKRVGYPLL